jgi:undecaprenyl-diphosphatase
LTSQTTTNLSRLRRGGRVSVGGLSAVIDFLAGLDVSIFRALNDFCGWSPALDRIVVHLEVLKGSLFMGIVGVLWYWPDREMPRRRETLLVMILAVALALVANRVISLLLPYRDRPMYSIGANAPDLRMARRPRALEQFPE